MQDILGYYAQIISLFIAIFFALNAGNGMVNQYLRYIDRLQIHREDVQELARNAALAMGFLVLAFLFRSIPFWGVLVIICTVAGLVNVIRLNRLISKMEK